MSTTSGTGYPGDGYYMVGTAQDPYLTIKTTSGRAPRHLVPVPITLPGGTINPGDKIRGLFGRSSAAGYRNFHPIKPGYVEYVGVILDELHDRVIAVGCPPHRVGVYLGWIVLGKLNDTVSFLVVTKSSASRRVTGDFVFLNDNYPPPESIDNHKFWRNYVSD